MTDIVERLRRLEVTICHEAADDIEMLRNENSKLRDHIGEIDDELDDAVDAIDRARAKANE